MRKVKVIENDAFEVGLTQNAAQFAKTLLNIADYIQIKYNNEVEEAVKILTKPVFNYLTMPVRKNCLMEMEMRLRKSQMTWKFSFGKRTGRKQKTWRRSLLNTRKQPTQ